MGYMYIFGSILFTVYGQIVLKWRVSKYGDLPDSISEKFIFLLGLLLDPFILTGFFSAFIASLFWMAAMTKFDVSYAYPFMSSAFVIVLMVSAFFLNEEITAYKALGVILIVIGIIISSQSS